MGIREMMNENRSVTTGAAIGITILAVLWIVFYTLGGGSLSGGDGGMTRSLPATPTTQ